jgi:hypothetical protein
MPRSRVANRPGPSTHQLQFLRFAQYNSWFNGQLFERVAELDDDADARPRLIPADDPRGQRFSRRGGWEPAAVPTTLYAQTNSGRRR